VVLRLPDSWSNWNLEMLVFGERGKLEYPEKNLLQQGREPTTNSTHMPALGFESGPHWWEASVLTTALHLVPINIILVALCYSSIKIHTVAKFVNR